MKKVNHPDIRVSVPAAELCCKKLKRFFSNLTDEEIRTLIDHSDSIRYHKKGELLYSEGTRIKGCYFVYSGIIKVYQTGQEGKEQIVKFDKEGDLFGFRSVICREPACSSTETLTDCILCYIPDYTLLNLLKNSAGFAYDMVFIACRELGDSNRYIRDIAQKTVRQRLAEILFLMAEDFGLESDGTLKLNITRKDLGNFVGTATETVIRLLSDYKTMGLVGSKGRKLKLLDLEKLKTVAGL